MSIKEKEYLELIKLHQALIYKVAAVYTNDLEDKKDLVQEIYFQIWKSYDTFQGQSKISTWFYRICMNTSIQYLKKKNRTIQQGPLERLSVEHYEDFSDKNDQPLQNLLASIQNLNELDKGIVLLYLESRSHKEIAEIIGISVSNVGTRFMRIKDKLKKMNNL